MQRAITRTSSTFGRLDAVVNNVGYGQVGSSEELSKQEARQRLNVNASKLLHVLRHAAPAAAGRGPGVQHLIGG